MNLLETSKRILILRCLTEGMSMRATARTVGCSKNTVKKLLIDAGTVCARYQHYALRGLSLKRIEVDEI